MIPQLPGLSVQVGANVMSDTTEKTTLRCFTKLVVEDIEQASLSSGVRPSRRRAG